ncbi:Iron-sulfur cluster co-chaperone protein HscB homolog [Linum grandiflorum]
MSTVKKLTSAALPQILRRRSLSSTTTTTYPPLFHPPPPPFQLPSPFPASTFSNPTAAHFLPNPRIFPSSSSLCSQSSPQAISDSSRCWNCNNAQPETGLFLVCDSCSAIQPVDRSLNYFRLFGLEKKYEIEDGNLHDKYKDWQKKLHPDLVHSKSEERDFAREQSARVGDAYRTLANPRVRAMYILKLAGVDVNEEETISDPELLLEIMEIREAVEDAPDATALNKIQSQLEEKLQVWSKSFANAFTSKNFEEAKDCIRRMTYYDRAIEEIVKRL